MKISLIFRAFILAAIPALVMSGCSQSVAPLSSSTYFIVPDSIVIPLYSRVSFVLHTTDLSAQTYKYAWDFGDGGVDTAINGNAAGHGYYKAGVFQVRAWVYDPQNKLLGSASAKVVVPVVAGQVSLLQHAYTVDNDTTVLHFQATVLPDSLRSGAYYTWSIDDTVQYDLSDTLSHLFITPGIHKVKVTAQYGFQYSNIPLGSDSAIITAGIPTATISDLTAMSNVSVTLPGQKVPFTITLPLQNGNGYSFSQTGASINTSYLSRYHQQVTPTEVVDSLRTRAIGVTMTPDGRYISLDLASILDSFFIAQPTQNVEHILRGSFSGGKLKLLSKSADSIVFGWYSTEPWGGYSFAAIDTTFDPTKTSGSGNSSGCCVPDPVIGLGGLFQPIFQPLAIVFRKQ